MIKERFIILLILIIISGNFIGCGKRGDPLPPSHKNKIDE